MPCAAATAQSWPAKPIRLLTGQAPGGATDFHARILAQKMNEALAMPVLVESRPGAAGSIAADVAARSAPDGYTLLLSTAGQMVINPHLVKLTYDPLKDLAPVAFLTTSCLVLATHPSVPAKSVKELVALARAHPGKLNHGSGGTGSPAHLAAELFKSKTGTRMTHVPFKGVGPAMVALAAGEIDWSFGSPAASLPHARVGRLRALAVSTPKRSRSAPDPPRRLRATPP